MENQILKQFWAILMLLKITLLSWVAPPEAPAFFLFFKIIFIYKIY